MPNDNTQRQSVYFIVVISHNTLKRYLKFCAVTSTKESHQTPKNQIPVAEILSPFLSAKVTLTNKVTLIDKKEIILGDYNNTAKVLNTFFSYIVSKLNIAEYLAMKLLLTISMILF